MERDNDIDQNDLELYMISPPMRKRSTEENLALRARDSIFVARTRKSFDEELDDEDEPPPTPNTSSFIEKDIDNSSTNAKRKSKSKVRFSSLPDDGVINEAFIGEEGRNDTDGDNNFEQIEDSNGETVQLRNQNKRNLSQVRNSIFLAKDKTRQPLDETNSSSSKENTNQLKENKRSSKIRFSFNNEQEEKQKKKQDEQNIDCDTVNNDSNDDYYDYEWNSFKSIPADDEDETSTSTWSELFRKLLKLSSYLITFLLVLILATISKLLFHLMANMTRVDKIVKVCPKGAENYFDNTQNYYSIVDLYSLERIAWIWMLYLVLIVPELLLLFRSVRYCLFKQRKSPNPMIFLMFFLSGSFQVLGVSLFVYLILPSIDAQSGLIFTSSLFLLPAACLWWSQRKKPGIWSKLYALATIVQLISLFIWPVLLKWRDTRFKSNISLMTRDDVNLLWLAPVAGILISFSYLENFLPKTNSNGILKYLTQMKQLSVRNKYPMQQFLSLWKCILYLVLMVGIQALIAGRNQNWSSASMSKMIWRLFAFFGEAFQKHEVNIVRKLPDNDFVPSDLHLMSFSWMPIIVFIIQVLCSFFCYKTVQFICKVRIQPFSFALPINLVLPVSVSVLNALANLHQMDNCLLNKQIETTRYIFWNVHYNIFDMNQPSYYGLVILWLVTFVSQLIVTNHIWYNWHDRLAPSDHLFTTPFYASALLDQSLMLNRKLVESSPLKNKATNDGDGKGEPNIKIYACATVWHETEDELLQMIKSIMRMDKDQCERLLAIKHLEVDPQTVDYYEFETHLFVDDAFVYKSSDKNDCHINEYVIKLISVLDKAAEYIHQRTVKILPPNIYVTPYGGRLEWCLPGNTNLIAHLKDKSKIRHRKRWSQVMYMYYLLGYKIYQMETNQSKRDKLTKNTFLLALDGDINFRPEAVQLLVDRMKIDSKLAAACGRVHPIGVGPIAWYQKFEYAVSHWLQKATEHVFGCVLCSPGCFSLFRASALVDINVMNRYTTKPTEALHYVQYDQGEDRWLCTLLLQQGWRVEYCAASDSFTHCPEGFDDFFIQRRRWAPSTMANIIDLLRSSKQTVKVNENISSIYMLYQGGLMLGTILSPGTIFLMLVGSMNSSFELQNQTSFYINFAPVLVFVLFCFFAKNNHQILLAQILSTFYVMLMLSVLVSTAIEIKTEPFTPSVIFFTSMITIFIIAGIMHPQEISCLLSLPIYMLTIPAMYLLLTIYSVINLNIVTWGTRENPQDKEQQQPQHPQAIPKESNIWNKITKSLPWNKSSEIPHKLLVNVDEEKMQQNTNEIKETKQIKYNTPRWIFDDNLQKAPVHYIDNDEEIFWNKFIKLYLQPLLEDKKKKKEISRELINLRNKAVFGFGIINLIFVLLVYLLQLHKDILSISIVTGEKYNGTEHFDDDKNRFIKDMEPDTIKIDPIGFSMIVFFGVILLIQFIGMFMHRFETIQQILANTDIQFFDVKKEDLKDDELLKKKSLQIVRFTLNENEIDNELDGDFYNIENDFLIKMNSINPNKKFQKRVGLRRKSIKAFNSRRNTIRRKSLALLPDELGKFSKILRNGSNFIDDYDDDDDSNINESPTFVEAEINTTSDSDDKPTELETNITSEFKEDEVKEGDEDVLFDQKNVSLNQSTLTSIDDPRKLSEQNSQNILNEALRLIANNSTGETESDEVEVTRL